MLEDRGVLSMAADINLAYKWAIDTCNAPNVGYSQSYRNENTVGGITYYDCSSFIWYALLAGGFPVTEAYAQVMGFSYSGNAIVTTYEQQWLSAMGFEQKDISGVWEPGDILWRSGHTEMVYLGGTAQGTTMGAHTANTTLANQVSINAAPTPASKWTTLWHWPGGGASDINQWIHGNFALDLSQMRNNAHLVKDYLEPKGWSLNAIAGILGNMQKESYINPGVWQNLDSSNPDLGYGLVQWTPSTKITNWLTEHGYDLEDGDMQLKWIDEETVQQGQWNPSSQYPMSFEAFKASIQEPETLAYVFMYNFEQPADLNQPDRKANARYWFDYLSGDAPTPPGPNPPGPGVIDSNRKMPVWMMLRKY